MAVQFRQATKRTAKLRLAVAGPSGSGKTYSSLSMAAVLGDKIAVVDTERGSASLYSDQYNFDVVELSPPFEPRYAVEAIKAAETAGYDVIIIDSLSHFWEAEGGVLDMVDAAAERARGNSWAGWKEGTPAYRHLVDTILAADLHVICAMRSKTEWILEKDPKSGKDKPVRIGLQPVMRAGIEYEFTLVGDISLEHTISISKSRCEAVADKVYAKHREKDLAQSLKAWLGTGVQPAGRAEIEALVLTMNEIPEPELRKSVKREFVEKFGQPEFLLAEQTQDAVMFLAGRLGVSATADATSEAPATESPALPTDVEQSDDDSDSFDLSSLLDDEHEDEEPDLDVDAPQQVSTDA